MTVLSGSPLNVLAVGRDDVSIGDEVVVFSGLSGEFSRGKIVNFYDAPWIVHGRLPMVTLLRDDGQEAHHSTQSVGLEPWPGGHWSRERFVLGVADALPAPDLIPLQWDNPNVLYML